MLVALLPSPAGSDTNSPSRPPLSCFLNCEHRAETVLFVPMLHRWWAVLPRITPLPSSATSYHSLLPLVPPFSSFFFLSISLALSLLASLLSFCLIDIRSLLRGFVGKGWRGGVALVYVGKFLAQGEDGRRVTSLGGGWQNLGLRLGFCRDVFLNQSEGDRQRRRLRWVLVN